jgi:catechol 2,3-dioxygenase-like lactoylglutathione lyase family enzyme
LPAPLVPEFAVRDCARSVAFYEALGFVRAYARPDEGFAYMQRDGAEIMLDQIGLGRDFDDGHLPDAPPFGRGLNLQIRVANLAPLLDALGAMGRPLLLAPEERWYGRGAVDVGQRQFVVADPDGYLLRFFEDLGSRPAGGA